MSFQTPTPIPQFPAASPLSAQGGVWEPGRLRAPIRSQWTETSKTPLVVISDSRIFATCFTRCLQLAAPEFDVLSYRDIGEWLASEEACDGIALLCAVGDKATEAAIRQIPQCSEGARVIIVSDLDSSALMMSALTFGAKGFVTMNTNLDLALGAIKLVNLGGSFIPTCSFVQQRHETKAPSPATKASTDESEYFTERQLDVLKLTRQGDPNKIIAHKLNLSQATVKVHLRNMMRKVKARNRIELILKSDELRGLTANGASSGAATKSKAAVGARRGGADRAPTGPTLSATHQRREPLRSSAFRAKERWS
ncbi:LuxR C-terminal-related transcriptional regulator [Methylovirgula sp. 4M-Z18]|uniref:LuxR C-terminal-related transcriptional regulator n=1 Tax=Methylovirgula sp. 4M-Z18 TaxID=2293567 RepID=UPI000E2FCBA9|nr:response regulator transcription factor [Methylovirgula sp. 4M-Z18]